MTNHALNLTPAQLKSMREDGLLYWPVEPGLLQIYEPKLKRTLAHTG